MRVLFVGLLSLLIITSSSGAASLRVLCYETYPFFYRENGQPVGFEYELLRLFAESRKADLDIKWVGVWEDILPMLERGEGDIVAATATITKEREEKFDFSRSYFPVRIVLVERRGQKTRNPRTLAGEKFATIKGTTYERSLATAIPDAQFIYAETERKLFELVSKGEAKALAVDSAVAIVLLPEFSNLQFGVSLSSEQDYGFVLPKGSLLKTPLDQHISRLKMSGIYFKLLERYFGSLAVEVIKSSSRRPS